MANPALVKTANGVGLSLNGVTIDPAGVTTANQALTWNGSAFVPGNVVPSFGNFTFSGNAFDINNAGTLTIGDATATAVAIGDTANNQFVYLGNSTGSIVYLAGHNAAGSSSAVVTWAPIEILAPSASAGATLKNSNSLLLQPHYWNGSADTGYNIALQGMMVDVGPTAKLSMQFGGVEKFQFFSYGSMTVPNTVVTPSVDSAAALAIGTGTATSIAVGSGVTSSISFFSTSFLQQSTPASYLVPVTSASAGTTLVNSPTHVLRGLYWNGSASTLYEAQIVNIVNSTTPTAYLSYRWGGAEKARLYDNSVFSVAAGGAFDVISAGNLNIGNGTATGINVGRAGCTINFGDATVTQTTSITTGVTINASSGVITTVAAPTAAQGTSVFTVTNSCVAATSVVSVTLGGYSGGFGVNGTPLVSVSTTASGSFTITIYNAHATAALNGTLKINFHVL